jgi:hypothetical protein
MLCLYSWIPFKRNFAELDYSDLNVQNSDIFLLLHNL